MLDYGAAATYIPSNQDRQTDGQADRRTPRESKHHITANDRRPLSLSLTMLLRVTPSKPIFSLRNSLSMPNACPARAPHPSGRVFTRGTMSCRRYVSPREGENKGGGNGLGPRTKGSETAAGGRGRGDSGSWRREMGRRFSSLARFGLLVCVASPHCCTVVPSRIPRQDGGVFPQS